MKSESISAILAIVGLILLSGVVGGIEQQESFTIIEVFSYIITTITAFSMLAFSIDSLRGE